LVEYATLETRGSIFFFWVGVKASADMAGEHRSSLAFSVRTSIPVTRTGYGDSCKAKMETRCPQTKLKNRISTVQALVHIYSGAESVVFK
jgi:hypothetical protein